MLATPAGRGKHAILTGYATWRQLREQNGGTVHLDLDQRTLTVVQG
ncbi:hypothetical protein [Streptomyces mirabilis]